MNNAPLRFKNGKFKIMLIGDLHERYDIKQGNGAAKSEDSLNLLMKAAEKLQPDLVVYMGDNASAKTEAELRTVISRIMYPFSVKNIPAAVVFGNHDHDCEEYISCADQLRLFREHDNCYMFNADDSISGSANYNLTIKASESDKDIYNLWFMDSNNLYENREESYYDWVHEDQINWYKNTAQALAAENSGKVLPALLFQHTPVPEEYELLREATVFEKLDSVPGHGKWSDKNYVLKDCVEGYLGEGPCSPCINGGQFAAWKEVGDVKGAFFGHDHMNDFVGYVDGIMLGQCKTAGFHPYTDGCRAGVRLITLDENNLDDIDTRMYYFKKDFGLKSKSLDLYKRNVTDRQDLKIKTACAVIGTAAAVTAVAVGTYEIYKCLKKK